MIRSPGTSGVVGNPVIGPEAVKSWMAVSWLVKVSCPGVRGAACAAAAAVPATASAASAPAATRVLICIVNRSSGSRSLLE
jgi:hypothetical protein